MGTGVAFGTYKRCHEVVSCLSLYLATAISGVFCNNRGSGGIGRVFLGMFVLPVTPLRMEWWHLRWHRRRYLRGARNPKFWARAVILLARPYQRDLF